MKKTIIALLFLTLLAGTIKEAKAEEYSSYPIIAKPTTTVEQMKTWAEEKGAAKEFIDQADTFYKVSVKYGIDPAVTYTQSAKETNFFKFTGVVSIDYHNPCGLKITQGGGDYEKKAHKKFTSWEEGITAQVHHLALYAGQAGFPMDRSQTPDPRHFDSIYAKAPNVEDLSKKWAPADSYGWSIMEMMYKLNTTLVDGKDPIPGPYKAPVVPVFKAPIASPSTESTKLVPKERLERIFGSTRETTAVKVSERIAEAGGTLILASSRQFADALVAAPLVKSENGKVNPILINSGNSLEKEVKDEIKRLAPTRVLVVGGKAGIPDSVVSEVKEVTKAEVSRISGEDRYETANRIADKIESKDRFILANGTNFADALAISPYASMKNTAILLTNGKGLDNESMARLSSSKEVIIVGGVNSVSQDIERKVEEKGALVTRIAGSNRYETAVEAAKFTDDKASVFIVANGKNFPDSLVGTSAAVKYECPILLTDKESLSPELSKYFSKNAPTNIIVLGGHGSISPDTYREIDLLIK